MTKNKVATQNENKRKLISIPIKNFINDYAYRIDIDADYQRDQVWSKEQREELLDSILENIDIPKIYLAEVKNNKEFDYECIDGKQRMLTLINFFKPEQKDKPLTVGIISKTYTYAQLKKNRPLDAERIENYELHFIVYDKDFFEEKTENFINKIFRRLQLGIRLNAGETLKSYTGTIRNFIFKDVGGNGPFLKNTGLSEKRYQKELALAQICFNSFSTYKSSGEFERARTKDIEEFFLQNEYIKNTDQNLLRIKKVLKLMNSAFSGKAKYISGRASAVSAYLFIENLYLDKKQKLIPNFVEFYLKLLNEIKENMVLLRQYKEPQNRLIMDKFQKHILQASVEPYSIKRRNEFLKEAFAYYLNPKTKGKIINGK